MSDEKKLSKVELIKGKSHFLRGSLAEALNDGTSHFSQEDIQLLKFHGSYQQDDRDLRKQLKKEGKERHYMMMIRARIPGGVIDANQYLQFDKLADDYGNGSMRITTRQTFQLHGILKSNLKATLKGINDVLITTLGGCGDQVRNTVGCGVPHEGPFYDKVHRDLMMIADKMLPKTNAYHEIWLDGERVNPDEEVEPMYGETYLPRKFKIAFAFEGDNCVDLYSNDVGIVAHQNGDDVEGYTLVIGGGMGRTVSDKKTSPHLAKPFCFVTPDKLLETVKTVVEIQRDYGDRENRKFARMKYLVADRGIEWFREEAERRLSHSLALPRELTWDSSHDHLGRIEGANDKVHLGLFIENGRIQDTDEVALKSVLRDVVAKYQPGVRMTTQQNLILTDLTPTAADEVEQTLVDAGFHLSSEHSPLLVNSMACPAMPTCGLAIAESERAMPSIIRQLEATLKEVGIGNEPITVRMTGCPNGCARPYMAEIGFVGRVIGRYDLFLGACPAGTRMNQLFKEMVPAEDIIDVLKPLFIDYRDERQANESFGDYCNRIGIEALQDRFVTV